MQLPLEHDQAKAEELLKELMKEQERVAIRSAIAAKKAVISAESETLQAWLDTQATNMATFSGTTLVSHLEGGFTGAAANLQGRAYESAKAYASSVLQPLLQGAQLLSEGLNTAVTALPAGYRSEVDAESLDSEELETEIATLEASQAAQANSLALLQGKAKKSASDKSNISTLQSQLDTLEGQIKELKEKLEKLLAFDETSSTYFDDLSALETAVSQGLAQVTAGFSSFSGTFTIPSKENMAWAQTITTAWENRQTNRLQTVSQPTVNKANVIGPVATTEVEASGFDVGDFLFGSENTIIATQNYETNSSPLLYSTYLK